MTSVTVPHENQGISVSLFGSSFADAAPPCGLTDTLIAFWFGNRAAGIADDVHTNNLDLTDMNTVTSNPGHVYPLARQYTLANNEYHVRPGDDALLSTGDVDFTIAVWAYLDSLATDEMLVTKYDYGAAQREYFVQYNTAAARFKFAVSSDGAGGASLISVSADNLGAPAISTWYLIVCWHDSVNDTINIQVNNGLVDSVAWANGVHDGTSKFAIGAYDAPSFYFDGRIGPTMFWKSAASGGGVLTDAQRTCLWNEGNGLQYGELT